MIAMVLVVTNQTLLLATLVLALIALGFSLAALWLFFSRLRHWEGDRAHLRDQIQRDPLTDLPGPLMLQRLVAQRLARAEPGGHCALHSLEVAGFDEVNQVWGETVGDELLIAIAARLSLRLRSIDKLARLQGSEFAILQAEVFSREDAHRLAQRLMQAFREPFWIERQPILVHAHLGFALYPLDADNEQQLFTYARLALTDARRYLRGEPRAFDEALQREREESQSLVQALREAVRSEEFMIFFQPQVSLESGMVIGAEALLRWQHTEWGLTTPDQFIELAERSGIIVDIGELMLEQTCREGARWLEQGLPAIRLAVNLSARQFHHPNLLGQLQGIIERTGFPPNLLTLEVRERELTSDVGHSRVVLQALREMGPKISLDDFGIGYSSLESLNRFSVNEVKLDPALVGEFYATGDSVPVGMVIIGLARTLSLRVVAEGVETREQARRLLAAGCREGQGFLFSPALPADDFLAFWRGRLTAS